MTVSIFAGGVGLLMALLLAIYLKRYRHQPEGVFSPPAAWLRAGIFFCFCYLVAWATGTLQQVLDEPIASTAQLQDPWWWSWVIGMLVFIILAYWVVWARYTIRFERQLEPVAQTVFGLLWGSAFGLLFLSFWRLAEMLGPDWATWQTWLLTYAVLSLWQWLLMDMYWDMYISPEHDTAYSIAFKVPTTHIPNVTLGLTFFALYENYLLFIASQVLALVGCSLAMRMPSPWCKQPTPASRQGPSIFWGLPRAVGYQSPDPANDPYLKQAHLPR